MTDGQNGQHFKLNNMKKLFLTSIVSIMCFSLFSQTVVYSGSNDNFKYVREDIDIVFTESEISIPKKQSIIATFLPTAVDAIFKATTKALEKRAKKFTAEYSKQKSYLNATAGKVPNFKFIRKVQLEKSSSLEDALEIEIEAFKVGDLGFVYQVKSIKLSYSAAKTARKSRQFDYTIELKLGYVIVGEGESVGEKKSVELAPIAISSVMFGQTDNYENLKHRTDIVPFVTDAFVTDVSIKVVETNPEKVRAEKILSSWNDHKDDVKTIINNYLPKEDKKEEASGDGEASSDKK